MVVRCHPEDRSLLSPGGEPCQRPRGAARRFPAGRPFKQRFPTLSSSQALGLALWSIGIVLARSASLHCRGSGPGLLAPFEPAEPAQTPPGMVSGGRGQEGQWHRPYRRCTPALPVPGAGKRSARRLACPQTTDRRLTVPAALRGQRFGYQPDAAAMVFSFRRKDLRPPSLARRAGIGPSLARRAGIGPADPRWRVGLVSDGLRSTGACQARVVVNPPSRDDPHAHGSAGKIKSIDSNDLAKTANNGIFSLTSRN